MFHFKGMNERLVASSGHNIKMGRHKCFLLEDATRDHNLGASVKESKLSNGA